MGDYYSDFNKHLNVYRIFRCGMAHEYLARESCVMKMLKAGDIMGLTIDPIMGIGKMSQGPYKYYFVVERYFEDFMATCRALYERKIAEPRPFIPST